MDKIINSSDRIFNRFWCRNLFVRTQKFLCTAKELHHRKNYFQDIILSFIPAIKNILWINILPIKIRLDSIPRTRYGNKMVTGTYSYNASYTVYGPHIEYFISILSKYPLIDCAFQFSNPTK
eukprot:688_1